MNILPVYYGDICVTISNEKRYPDWSITEFMLCRVSSLYLTDVIVKMIIKHTLKGKELIKDSDRSWVYGDKDNFLLFV